MNQNYKVDDKVQKHPQFKLVEECLDRLCLSSTLENLPGNCISACDILQNMLNFYGISSQIIECQLMAIKQNTTKKDFCFVGFTNVGIKSNDSIDTHVVVVTQTDPPILIDASVGHLLPEENKIIVKVLDNLDPTIILNFEIDDLTFTYHHKKIIRLPSLHQKNLVDRFKEEHALKQKYEFVTKMLYVIAGFTLYNFIANNLTIILKILFP